MTLSSTNPLSLFIHGSDDVDPRTSRPGPSNPMLVPLPTVKRSPPTTCAVSPSEQKVSKRSVPLLSRSLARSSLTSFLGRRPRRSLKIILLIARCLSSLVLLLSYNPPAGTRIPSSVGQSSARALFIFRSAATSPSRRRSALGGPLKHSVIQPSNKRSKLPSH